MKRKVSAVLFVFFVMTLGGRLTADAEAPLSHDRVVIYEMKEDPTVATFLNVKAVPGFYGLELDERNGAAAIYFKVGEAPYRAETDLKVKGDQLILTYQKRTKIFVRAQQTLSDGGTREIIYPIECGPERAGWRHGTSLERHVVRRGDEDGKWMTVNSASLEFEATQERCQDPSNGCGAPGCKEWDVAAASGAANARVASSPSPSPAPSPTIPFSKALLEAKLTESAFLAAYPNEIDTVLPPTLHADVTAVNTSYKTTTLPYPGMSDPIVEQKALKIGVISKKYLLEDKTSTLSVDIEPLPAEFQAPLPGKCGTWASDAGKTFFDVRGQPAVYAATGGGSSLTVCGQKISVSLQTSTLRTKEALMIFIDDLPFNQIESLAGTGK